MSIATWILCGYALIYMMIMFLSWISYRWLGPINPVLPEKFPAISMLIAARNEEKYVAACIHAIQKLDYPKEKLYIYIGDDGSEDATKKNAIQAIGEDSRFYIIDIPRSDSAGGKARVLEILSQHVQTELIYILDADTLIGKNTLKGLLASMTEKTAIVSGVTVLGDGSMQDFDWRFYMLVLQGAANMGIPGTAVGNNMLIKTSALQSIGGLKAVPFSVTEDFALFKAFVRAGYGWANVFSPEVINFTFPAADFRTLIHQRKRWTSGGMDFPWYWIICFAWFGVYPFMLILGFCVAPPLAMSFMLVRMVFHALFQWSLRHGYHFKTGIGKLLVYEFYMPCQLFIQAYTMFFPRVIWKNRKY